jgi:hypothetical protein
MIVLLCGLSGFIGTTSIGYLLTYAGIGEHTSLLAGATIVCAVCSLVVYHQGIEEGAGSS